MVGDEVTVEEAARIIGMHPGAVRRAIQAGRITARRIGQRVYLIEREEAERYRDNAPKRGRPRTTPPKEPA